MRDAEILLTALLEGELQPEEYERVMPFHCLDSRYKMCASFMRRFYPGGFGGMSPGPTLASYGEGISTLCYLTERNDGEEKVPIAAVIGEHADCALSRREVGTADRILLERRTWERTNDGFEALIRRDDVRPALNEDRLALVITRTEFSYNRDGELRVRYRVLPLRTNMLLEEAGYRGLSRDFVNQFQGRILEFRSAAPVVLRQHQEPYWERIPALQAA